MHACTKCQSRFPLSTKGDELVATEEFKPPSLDKQLNTTKLRNNLNTQNVVLQQDHRRNNPERDRCADKATTNWYCFFVPIPQCFANQQRQLQWLQQGPYQFVAGRMCFFVLLLVIYRQLCRCWREAVLWHRHENRPLVLLWPECKVAWSVKVLLWYE